jgi:hypothetical protein
MAEKKDYPLSKVGVDRIQPPISKSQSRKFKRIRKKLLKRTLSGRQSGWRLGRVDMKSTFQWVK